MINLTFHVSPQSVLENPLSKSLLVVKTLESFLSKIIPGTLIVYGDGKYKQNYENERILRTMIQSEAANLEDSLQILFVVIARLEVAKLQIKANTTDTTTQFDQEILDFQALSWIKEENDREKYFAKHGYYSWVDLELSDWIEIFNRRTNPTIKHQTFQPLVRDFGFFKSSTQRTNDIPPTAHDRSQRRPDTRNFSQKSNHDQRTDRYNDQRRDSQRSDQYNDQRRDSQLSDQYYNSQRTDRYNDQRRDSQRYEPPMRQEPKYETPKAEPDPDGWCVAGQKRQQNRPSPNTATSYSYNSPPPGSGRGQGRGSGTTFGRGRGRAQQSSYGRSW